MANQQATIVVKKIKKVSGGHSGGAWKIAYADFVTAMMAFFLLLWLLNSVTQEALEGISNYFAPVSISSSTSGSGGVLGGQVLSVEGAGTSQSGQLSKSLDLNPPRAGTGGDAAAQGDVSEEEARKKVEQVEQDQFKAAEKAISEAVEASPELKELAESLQMENTPQGLQIQIVDMDNFSMFHSGSAVMNQQTQRMIALVSKVVHEMTQKLSIAGHTDAVPFLRNDGYSNWELSADRANSARRELLYNEIPEERFSQVVGRAATDPLLPEDPKNASNRRLSIILLKGTGHIELDEDTADKDESQSEPPFDNDNTASGLKKANNSLVTKKTGSIAESLIADDEELALPGLDQIKQKQLETSQ